ncbi:E3 ubiquitin-protein ligase RNF25 [Cololabis saira]|uniref:E3 ubiquitin-protein ligase RNF25 n=1 Tax=Cololabis saira TaxID=129043 RepID=UPI002AD513A7|nr:E3 ubiquitin-protein ligase RNF25 [Cololabis saira]
MMAAESDVQSEIEVLESIYLDDLQVDRRRDGGWEVSLVLYPSTGEDSVSQFVRLTLTLTLDQQYPSSSPAISIQNPRGLSDDKLHSVQTCLQVEAQSCLGSPVLYQLIEKAKEILTESNIPHGNCVICLYGFKEGESFTKTSCYHYFHSHCLGRYVCHSERELQQREKELQEDKTRDGAEHQELTVVCPVCREPLAYDIDQLLSSPAPRLPELDEAAIGSDFQHKWCELQKVLEKQRAKGGIIDPEVESNRFLIHTNETPPVVENGNPEADASPEPPTSSSLHETCARADQFAPGTSHCRGVQGQRRQNQMKGPRRGGGARFRPQYGRAVATPEKLEKLSLSSDCMDESDYRRQNNHDRQMQRNPESSWSRTGRENSAVQQDLQVSPDRQAIRQPALGTDLPKDAGIRGHRGRRRGPHQPAAHAGASGPAWHHCDGQASRSRGGGLRQGHGRSFQRKVVERGREEVL